ncbi:MAG: Tim44/TimA family putative adaptor protein [Alphaproteobacteria bacterium]
MSTNLDVFTILVLAALAAFLGLRLWSVLGRRTGHERPRPDPYSASERQQARGRHEGEDNVVVMPGGRQSDADAADIPGKPMGGGEGVSETLQRIAQADRTFDSGSFLSGARTAYEMIVTAFAKGERETLKPLLSEEVFESFDAAIAERERRGESREVTLVGINRAAISDAEFDGREAEITVTFVSEQISITKNEAGAVIQGDPTTVRQVTDVWTFARDTRASDPNWLLVGTAGG